MIKLTNATREDVEDLIAPCWTCGEDCRDPLDAVGAPNRNMLLPSVLHLTMDESTRWPRNVKLTIPFRIRDCYFCPTCAVVVRDMFQRLGFLP